MSRSRNRARQRRNRQRRKLDDPDQVSHLRNEESTRKRFTVIGYFYDYLVAFLFFAVVVMGLLTARSLMHGHEETKSHRVLADDSTIDLSVQWDEQYPLGYKVIALTSTGMIPTKHDTFTGDFRYDWNDLRVSRIEANQLSGTIEKIMVSLEDVAYEPEGVKGLTVSTQLSRTEGAQASLARFHTSELIVKIIKDDGERLFVLIGIKYL